MRGLTSAALTWLCVVTIARAVSGLAIASALDLGGSVSRVIREVAVKVRTSPSAQAQRCAEPEQEADDDDRPVPYHDAVDDLEQLHSSSDPETRPVAKRRPAPHALRHFEPHALADDPGPHATQTCGIPGMPGVVTGGAGTSRMALVHHQAAGSAIVRF